MPGGVNSPVRAFKNINGNPIFFEKAKGAYLFDADGNKYNEPFGLTDAIIQRLAISL